MTTMAWRTAFNVCLASDPLRRLGEARSHELPRACWHARAERYLALLTCRSRTFRTVFPGSRHVHRTCP